MALDRSEEACVVPERVALRETKCNFRFMSQNGDRMRKSLDHGRGCPMVAVVTGTTSTVAMAGRLVM
jgi:hypothetical protein